MSEFAGGIATGLAEDGHRAVAHPRLLQNAPASAIPLPGCFVANLLSPAGCLVRQGTPFEYETRMTVVRNHGVLIRGDNHGPAAAGPGATALLNDGSGKRKEKSSDARR
ncbi:MULTISPECIES: hypothetical protein [unclassified Micromonospora]|uniref:hypothetical protein n=1 Tax=unclassified Micromonospora TaxID=2617518 RepID=UPI001B38281B|nr:MULTISPECIES: hypothetical protein [unclassified Micromonospora]MBQ1044926.1 hypothetical protein [Micromonospora sp. C72]MBQ1056004.1 hypothetical protein [Micromonospora sp. C32]